MATTQTKQPERVKRVLFDIEGKPFEGSPSSFQQYGTSLVEMINSHNYSNQYSPNIILPVLRSYIPRGLEDNPIRTGKIDAYVAILNGATFSEQAENIELAFETAHKLQLPALLYTFLFSEDYITLADKLTPQIEKASRGLTELKRIYRNGDDISREDSERARQIGIDNDIPNATHWPVFQRHLEDLLYPLKSRKERFKATAQLIQERILEPNIERVVGEYDESETRLPENVLKAITPWLKQL